MNIIGGKPLPLGVSGEREELNFSISVKAGEKCELLLYKAGEEIPTRRIELPEETAVGEIRFLAVKDLEKEICEYSYCIENQMVIDPYAKAFSGQRARIVTDRYDWEGDKPLEIPYHKVVAYTLHVKGFTKQKNSKVKHKGTFAGMIEKLPYLEELGINQVQCMPVYAFQEGKYRTNYWGYGPAYCFAPQNAYAASDDAVSELKDMVKAYHKAGIEVVLELPFTSEISIWDMQECLHYYHMEYHIDGFLLNDYAVPFEELRRDPLLKHAKLMRRQDGFQTAMRRFLKGDEGMVGEVMRQLRHLSEADGVFNYITAPTGFTLEDLVSYDGKHNEENGENNQDGPVYNYSWNCGSEGVTRKKAILELRKKQVRNAMFLLLFAQGTPCILSGDEFGNSQQGNNNVYCQDNETGWLDWSRFSRKQDLFQYVKCLIRMRKEHPILHPQREMLGIDYMACGVPDISYHGEHAWQVDADIASRQLGVYYSGSGLKDDEIFITYNMHWEEHVFALPTLPKGKVWYKVLSTSDGIETAIKVTAKQKKVHVKERTIEMYVGRKENGED